MLKYLLLVLIPVSLLVGQTENSRTESYPFENRIIQFEQMDQDSFPAPNSVLFIGSSSIAMWKTLARDMAPIPVINRGFGGSQAHQALHYMPRIVFPYKPKAIVFYEGDNDIAAGKAPSQFITECKAFYDSVQIRLPHTPVYFLSVKPSYARIKLERERKEANRLLREFCESNEGAEFVDVASVMFDSAGVLKQDIFLNDQLHLNERGYALWTEIIKKRLSGFLEISESK